MKTRSLPVLCSLLTLLLAASPAVTFAGHGPGPGQRPGHGLGFGPGHGGGFGDGFMAGRMAERLGLSDDQLERIRTLRESYRDQAQPLMDALRDARLALNEQIHADLFDETAVREAASGVAAVEADLAVLRARMSSDVHQVLTPEQAAEARAMRERMRAFADERDGRPGWGRRGPHGPPVDGG